MDAGSAGVQSGSSPGPLSPTPEACAQLGPKREPEAEGHRQRQALWERGRWSALTLSCPLGKPPLPTKDHSPVPDTGPPAAQAAADRPRR